MNPLNTQNILANAQSNAQTNELIARQKQFKALAGGGQDKDGKLREACKGFEAVFVQKMWEQMRATIPEGGYLKGKEEKFWQSMYDQELAKKMTDAGGIGLADMMYEQLSKGLADASKDSSTSVASRKPLEVSNVPLLPEPVRTAEASGAQTGQNPALSVTVAADSPATPAAAGATDQLQAMYSGEAEQPQAAVGAQAENGKPAPVDMIDAPRGENAEQTLATISNNPPPMPATETQTSMAVSLYLAQLQAQSERNTAVLQTPTDPANAGSPNPGSINSNLTNPAQANPAVTNPTTKTETQPIQLSSTQNAQTAQALRQQSTLPPVTVTELQAAINPPAPEKQLRRSR